MEDYHHRVTFEVTKHQKDILNEQLKYGDLKKVFAKLTDDLIKMYEKAKDIKSDPYLVTVSILSGNIGIAVKNTKNFLEQINED